MCTIVSSCIGRARSLSRLSYRDMMLIIDFIDDPPLSPVVSADRWTHKASFVELNRNL